MSDATSDRELTPPPPFTLSREELRVLVDRGDPSIYPRTDVCTDCGRLVFIKFGGRNSDFPGAPYYLVCLSLLWFVLALCLTLLP